MLDTALASAHLFGRSTWRCLGSARASRSIPRRRRKLASGRLTGEPSSLPDNCPNELALSSVVRRVHFFELLEH